MRFIIAGIGSRKINSDAFEQIKNLTVDLIEEFKNTHVDFWIRSGHAEGSDYAFECGAQNRCIVYLPWKDFGSRDGLTLQTNKYILWNSIDSKIRKKALDSVYKYHPYPNNLSPGAQKCLGRDYFQVFGSAPKSDPVDAVVCWAIPKGSNEVAGGTGQAVRIANDHNIPVYNLFTDPPQEIIENLKELAALKFDL